MGFLATVTLLCWSMKTVLNVCCYVESKLAEITLASGVMQ
jgi:hypothetical protein